MAEPSMTDRCGVGADEQMPWEAGDENLSPPDRSA
jgi:hypothetical protein